MIGSIIEIAFVLLVLLMLFIVAIDTIRYSIKSKRFRVTPLITVGFWGMVNRFQRWK